MSTEQVAARVDIHKSCKTFEAVVNYLNDYSEAVAAIIAIQKKLVKALRDAAAAKATSEVAGMSPNIACLMLSEPVFHKRTR